ncbi:MAG: nucleotide exchange factor GrpE [Acholeplasmatales bacterium]|jgi:molecular chaperone GrpE|nr:nucleotide exchange factor GrpE [Acholeplasmataceae bacterium]MDY0115071.1 nucleotide exchange factor GrpE [Acholeplasmatales bacterium]MCK9234034.1 nucleotide exchange factor GrpE [Acholeplasmataceae bacterium]MCK9289177.1 nucleotide exchange factor GrpE [Acholeplasmataceae bacterium]MCK9427059.1 nucleotide exchange factor GrpE [Acholeplasmataceae bacterium]
MTEKDLKETKRTKEPIETPEKEPKEEVLAEKVKKKTKTEKLKDEINELKLELLRLKEKNLQILADSENLKKRLKQEREQEKKYHNQYLIEKLLPALDQLRLVVNSNVSDEKLNNYLIGFKMINDEIFQTLANDGLTPIEAVGEMFDPKLHHALEKEVDKTKAKGIVLKQTLTGYKYKERIIRPAMVVVNDWSDENGNNK